MPQGLLAQVLSAANYMAIPPLLDLTCLKYTFLLMGKSAEEVRPTCTQCTEWQCCRMGIQFFFFLPDNSPLFLPTAVPFQVRSVLNLPELTPEEVQRAREKYPFLFDQEVPPSAS
jgi:hypothetical protein